MASIAITGNRNAALAEGDPLVPRMLLGRTLRRLRSEAGLTREDAGRAVGGSSSKISRLELGQVGFKVRDVAALLDLYAATDDAERTTLLTLAEQSTKRPWWYGDRALIPPWVRPYLSAEQTGKLVRSFEDTVVPGLLQTESYARALIRRQHPADEVERRVAFRMGRQRVLRRRPRPLNLWVVLDQAALFRPVGDAAVMREQLRHLDQMCWRPNVTIQLGPFDMSRDLQTEGPLTLVRFPQQDLPDMVYLERADTALYPVGRAQIERHWHNFNTLVTEAFPPERTPDMLQQILAMY